MPRGLCLAHPGRAIVLIEAVKAKPQNKTRTLRKRSVDRSHARTNPAPSRASQACVSHAFRYTCPELGKLIEHLRGTRQKTSEGPPSNAETPSSSC